MLRILIEIFDKYTLPGMKYLDYLSLREAFFLYFDRNDLVTKCLPAKIARIRDNHNIQRTEFNMPSDFKPNRNYPKILGLIEGEGSFLL